MQPALRSPPAFEVSAGGDFVWRALCAGLYGLTAAALLLWAWSHQGAAGWLGLPLLVGVPAAGWLGWRLSRQPPRRLRWDGQRWFLIDPAPDGLVQPVRVLPVIELDAWLMLRLTAIDERASRWRFRPGRLLRVDRSSSGPNWALLRATLHLAGTVSVGATGQGTQP